MSKNSFDQKNLFNFFFFHFTLNAKLLMTEAMSAVVVVVVAAVVDVVVGLAVEAAESSFLWFSSPLIVTKNSFIFLFNYDSL